jgi:hypothetical protein
MKHQQRSLVVLTIVVALLVSLSGPLADWVFPYYNVADASGPLYTGVLIVAKNAPTYGDYSSITGALNAISTHNADNRWLIWVAPGTYTETVTMKTYVDIEGAGEGLTIIYSNGGAATSSGATVTGASNAELRFLTVKSTVSDSTAYAVGIYNSSASPRLTHVSVAASGGTSTDVYGIYDTSSSSPALTDVTITASGGTGSGGTRGVYHASGTLTYTKGSITVTGASGKNAKGLDNAATATLTEVSISVEGGGLPQGMGNNYSYAVYNTSADLALRYVTLKTFGTINYAYGIYTSGAATFTDVGVTATGTSGQTAYGIYNDAAAVLTNVAVAVETGDTNYGVYNNDVTAVLNNVTVTAKSTSSTTAYGVYNYHNNTGDPTLTLVSVKVSGAGTNNYGIYNYRTASVIISDSVIDASGGTNNYGVYNDAAGNSSTTTIRNSQVRGDTTGTKAIYNTSGGTIYAGGSLADGNTNNGVGTWHCVAMYNGGYSQFYQTSCP